MKIIVWAIQRAGFGLEDFYEKHPEVALWVGREKEPTYKQLEKFAKQVFLPFGYLFLPEPPEEELPIPFFRTLGKKGPSSKQINVHVYDTILLLQQRQDWLRSYLEDNGEEPLPFVGKFDEHTPIETLVNDIRETLQIGENWAVNPLNRPCLTFLF